jgi:hypothetical protein
MRRPWALIVLSVSVTSTIASARPETALASVAPQENSILTTMFRSAKYRRVYSTSSVAIFLPARSSSRLIGDGQHPARRPRAHLGVDEVRHDVHVGAVFGDPVLAGEPGVQRPAFHIAGHLLGAADGTFNEIVIDFREITAAVHADGPARALEQRDRRLLEAALGDPQLQLRAHFV